MSKTDERYIRYGLFVLEEKTCDCDSESCFHVETVEIQFDTWLRNLSPDVDSPDIAIQNARWVNGIDEDVYDDIYISEHGDEFQLGQPGIAVNGEFRTLEDWIDDGRLVLFDEYKDWAAADRQEAIRELCGIVEDSKADAIYTTCIVSEDGTRRLMNFHLPVIVWMLNGGEDQVSIRWITPLVARILGEQRTFSDDDYRQPEGIIVSGCGMDMGWSTVNAVASMVGIQIGQRWL